MQKVCIQEALLVQLVHYKDQDILTNGQHARRQLNFWRRFRCIPMPATDCKSKVPLPMSARGHLNF
eukprot:1156824-Pelagomonas_calceolata.AAC.5